MNKVFFLIIYISFSFSSLCKTPINMASANEISILEIISIIANECKVSLIIEDDLTKKNLKYKINSIYLSDKNISEALGYLLDAKFFWSLEGNSLKISYLKDSVFYFNYINTVRSLTNTLTSQAKDDKNKDDKSEAHLKSTDDNDFWQDLEDRLNKIINKNKKYLLIVDKNTGSIFLRADRKTSKTIRRYLKSQKEKLHLQVLIEMNIYNVSLNDGHQEGVNWQLLQDVQSFNVGASLNVVNGEETSNLNVGKKLSVDSLIDFINTFGKTSSLSNPKLLILNNQPAIISIGDETYYKIKKSTITQNTSTIIKSNEEILSIFSGILISITPSIEDDTIILKINQTVSDIQETKERLDNIPPNKTRNEISTIIKLRNKEKAILGGLISKNDVLQTTSLPVLGSIPGISFLFTNSQLKTVSNELIIVIEARIIE